MSGQSYSPLQALSPLDGRYILHCFELVENFSEAALHRNRAFVELRWFQFLLTEGLGLEISAQDKGDAADSHLYADVKSACFDAMLPLDDAGVLSIHTYEQKIRHDVKSVEYFLRDCLQKSSLSDSIKKHIELIHFGCTSEDINNVAYTLALKQALDQVIFPAVRQCISQLQDHLHAVSPEHSSLHFKVQYKALPMLAMTHGQPASPTTYGKEVGLFAVRCAQCLFRLSQVPLKSKFNGSVGNYHALSAVWPEHNWELLCCKFVNSLRIEFEPFSTQIEQHDHLVTVCHILSHLNTIMIGCCQDLWQYLSRFGCERVKYRFLLDARGRLKLKLVRSEVGSSVMPHKLNPIDFENAEGNLGLANSLLNHFCMRLPISRFQRDLSDSTVLRNIGSALGYSLIGYKAFCKGMSNIVPDEAALAEELENHYEVLAEALQTHCRLAGIPEGYELLKELTRGTSSMNQDTYRDLYMTLRDKFPAERHPHLDNVLGLLRPGNYTGRAAIIADEMEEKIAALLRPH